MDSAVPNSAALQAVGRFLHEYLETHEGQLDVWEEMALNAVREGVLHKLRTPAVVASV